MTMVSVSKNTVLQIKQVLNIEAKPKWIEPIILSNLKEGLRLQKLIVQKDFLDLCVRRKVCPPEIMTLARRVGSQNDGRRREIP